MQAKKHPILSIILSVLSVLLFVAFWDYTPLQSPEVSTRPAINIVGTFGAQVTFWSLHFLGLTAWALPFMLGWMAYKLWRPTTRPLKKVTVCTACAWVLLNCILIQRTYGLWSLQDNYYSNYFSAGIGGVIGNSFVFIYFRKFLGSFGSFLVILAAWGTLLFYTFINKDIFFIRFERALLFAKASWIAFTKPSRENRPITPPPSRGPLPSKDVVEPTKIASTENFPELCEEHEPPKARTEGVEKPSPTPAPTVAALAPKPSAIKIIKEDTVERASISPPKSKGNYIFPSTDLLNVIDTTLYASDENHAQTAETLVQTLKEFGIQVTPGEVHAGPVITRYEVTPAPGVRVEKIVNLDKNIALSLRATSVRIIAPVPGKGCVGIEVPNKNPSQVCLREIIESKVWAESKAEIPLVLGKEVTGKPIIADLTRMPHLLIAGSTGSGKTVCINTIIASLLYKNSPQDLRFLMVDPKIVEMQVFNSLPHMLIPVVTDPKKVPSALKWLLKEMEYRYQVFAGVGVRNIAGFNAKILKNREDHEKANQLDAELSPEERAAMSTLESSQDYPVEIPRHKLPYIVCVIDELADLMMVAPADIETAIARLAQLARAAGIHLIIATQRPSVNVITGVIKANLPSRIAFKVASKVDSRTIIDGGGADALIGRGDMLFIPPGVAHQVRAQGAFVSDDEINRIVEFLKVNGAPQFEDSVQKEIDSGLSNSESDENNPWDDDLMPQAIEIIQNAKRASTSMLQRKLRIGYNRAARIMDILEEQGYVGPENGSSPREVYGN